jgi:hypothetical protein
MIHISDVAATLLLIFVESDKTQDLISVSTSDVGKCLADCTIHSELLSTVLELVGVHIRQKSELLIMPQASNC